MHFRGSMARITFSFAALGMFAGCGSVYRAAAEEFHRTQPPSAWGQQPPEGHVEVQKAYVASRLKDPDSVRFQVGALQRVTISASLTDPTVVPVWESPLHVNAKNSFGGYVGFKTWSFYYRDGSLFAVDAPETGRQYIRKP